MPAQYIRPFVVADLSDAMRLIERENSEIDVVFGKDFQGRKIDSGFWQPQTARLASEAMFKIADTPDDLGSLIAVVRQRHDDVVLGLRNGRTMPGEQFLTFNIGLQNRLIDIGLLAFQPR